MASPDPALYAVFGHPIAHSLSPRLHAAAYRACGVRGRYYVPVDVEPERLGAALVAFAALGGRGVNLTRPLKDLDVLARAAGPSLGDVARLAHKARAANTLRLEPDGRWSAHNTDVVALAAALAVRSTRDGPAVLFGAGGAARASLAALGARSVIQVVRRPEQPRDGAPRQVGWEEGLAATPGAALVLNATPLGQSGEPDWEALPHLAAGQVVVDWAYRDEPTRLARHAAASGCRVVEGRELLVRQAAEAWRIWFSADASGADIAAVMEAMARELGMATPAAWEARP